MANVDIQIGKKNATFFSANPTLVLENGQLIFNETTGLLYIGDGSTQLSALVAINVSSGGGTVDSVTGTANRIAITGTAADPIVNIDPAYDSAITSAISSAVSGKEDSSNKQTDLTASATKFPTVNAVIAGLNTKVVPFTHSPSAVISPADGQYYYFGMQNLGTTNAAGNTQTNLREIGAPVTGTIIAAVISIRLDNGTTVSNETSTLYLRNTTQNTIETITSTFTYVATGSPSFKSVVVTGLNIAISAGDLCMSVIGNPNFATNPSTVYYRVDYIIQT